MKRKIFLFLITGLLVSSCEIFQPQSPTPESFFVKFFGGSGEQEGVSIQILNEETIYVFGYTNSVNNTNQLHLINMDKAGNERWVKTLDGGGSTAVDLKLTESQTDLILLSDVVTASGLKTRLTKTDLDGTIIWDKTLNTQNGVSYAASRISTITGTTNFLVVGTEMNPAGQNGNLVTRIYVSELDTDGNFVWEKTYSFTDRKAEYGVDVQALNGNVVVLGRSVALNGIERPILIEANRTSIGEELQSEILFESNTDLPSILRAKEMLLTTNNEFIVLCSDNTNVGILKVLVSSEDRITPELPNFLTINMSPLRFTQTQNNDLLITGVVNQKIGLMRVNSQGVNVWNAIQKFGTGRVNINNVGRQVAENADGSILTVGTIDFFDKKMIGVIKATAEGKLE
jgi:hypothetical protein